MTGLKLDRVLVSQDSWRPMTLEQCKELTRDPLIEVGAHTHTHRNFRGDPRGLQQDLRDCLEFLQLQLAVKAAAFSFPFGIADPDLFDVARRAGVLCALTNDEKLVNPQSEPFGWSRFGVEEYDTPSTLAACLGGLYSDLNSVVRRYSPWVVANEHSPPDIEASPHGSQKGSIRRPRSFYPGELSVRGEAE